MSQEIMVSRSRLLAAATAISAVGLLVVPAPAQALPMIPLAPVCSFNGTYVLNQSNGFRVEFPWNGTSPSGTAISYGNDQKPAGTGPVSGGISSANEVAVIIDWAGPSQGQYVGKLDSLGNVRGGSTQDIGVPGNTAAWDSVTPLNCVEAPAAPVVKPADPVTPAQQTATVKKASNVYDLPGGNGNRVGGENYFLAAGRQLKVVQPCADDWCYLEIPDAQVPGGKGWVYQAEGYLDVK
jgi:hypothetical protein